MDKNILSKKEKNLLRLISFLPILFILILSVVSTYLIVYQNNHYFQKEIKKFKEEFISSQKEVVKYEVNRVESFIKYKQKNTYEKLKATLIEQVDEAYSIIDSIYKNNQTLSKYEILQLIKNSMRDIRFNDNRGYFFVYTLKGTNILHPLKPSLEGKNLWNHKDLKGTFIARELTKRLESNNTAFLNIWWYKNKNDSKEYQKIMYAKKHDKLGIYVGTGEYIKDFEDDLKKDILNDIQNMNYGRNGYVFIVDFEGNYLSHIKKAYIGLNRIDLVDKNGFEITKEIINSAKRGEEFISYIGTIMPETNKPAYKTTFVKGMKNWQWAIASGFYLDEVNKIIKEKEKELDEKNRSDITFIFKISVAITLFLIIVSLYFSYIVKQKFLDHRKKILLEIEKNREKDKIMFQQSKMASMGEMIANIAHQWRQPLSAISTASSGIAVKLEYGISDEEDTKKDLKEIVRITNYLSNTIEDFRSFFSNNKKVEEFLIKEVLVDNCNMVYKTMYSNNIDVVFNIKDDSKLTTLKNELIQVFLNILNNSKDAILEKVNENDRRLVFVDCYEKDKHIIIKIKDNAGGIADNIKDRIFEPYFTTKHKSQGTGLGLYMSREIIVNHLSGEFSVKNKEYTYEDKKYIGAQFKVKLQK